MTRKKLIILSALISAIVLSIPFVCNESLKDVYYTVKTDKVTAPVKLAFISDLHNTRYGKNMSELIASVDIFHPDAVILGGDLFDKDWGEANSSKFTKEMLKRYKCFYSLGNHEFKYDNNEKIKKKIKALGVIVLDGKNAELNVSGTSVRISGIDGGIYKDELENCKKGLDESVFNILINHYPEEFPYMSSLGFDLILSGHAHGGQWRFPPFINGVLSPGEGLFPKYAGGMYNENNCTMIVSRGLQRTARDIIIPRIFNRPEAVYITIKPAE